jgi:molybdopterin converting factor small subunit
MQVKSNGDWEEFFLFMAKIKFTSALKRFFPSLTESDIEGNTVKQVLDNVEKVYPGISTYLVDDHGHLRRHLNIFINGDLIKDRLTLRDNVSNSNEILIFQALSGG